jgi:F-type H+-transporting ATPase subunit gamma
MAKTQDLKRRIRSISNTRQLTRAMKMVSASKLRRAQERITKARPYAHLTLDMLRSVAARANPELHPLLQPRHGKRQELLVVTGDRGLCGSFNSAITRTAETFAAEHPDRELKISAVGKRGRDYFKHRKYDLEREWVDVSRSIEFPLAKEIAGRLMDAYLEDEVDQIYVVYNEFKSAIQARPIVQPLLPVEPMELEAGATVEDYFYEPGAEKLFETLLPHYVEVTVFHALIESAAAEHAARMTAMDSATNNAGELIENLTLTMNRVRQASITTEIIEVVSGAEALG